MFKDATWEDIERLRKESEEMLQQMHEEAVKRREEEQKRKERESKAALERWKREQAERGAYRKAYRARKIANGEFFNPFIEQHLKAQISAARWALALGMITTVLFKGQIMLWTAMIIYYVCYVKKAKREHLEADRKEAGIR
jgi:hypothetical protein